MTLLHHALRAGATKPHGAPMPRSTLLLAGAGGALGSAVLEALLAGREHGTVRVLATRPLGTAMPGLEPIIVRDDGGFDQEVAFDAAPIADAALIVFDRARHANGRERAFLRPEPGQLGALAGALRQRGVRALIIVMPHSAAQLPDALKRGLANLDEHAVASLDFEHLVFVRSAQAPSDARATQWLQRLADGMLAQMQIMVAATQQAVRAVKVARFVAALAAQLASSPPGIRIAPPELVWQASQLRDPAPLVDAWLAARDLPDLSAPKRRW